MIIDHNVYTKYATMYWSKARLPWIDSLLYRVYNTMPIPQNVGLLTFYKHPGQTWIQAQMVKVMLIFFILPWISKGKC